MDEQASVITVITTRENINLCPFEKSLFLFLSFFLSFFLHTPPRSFLLVRASRPLVPYFRINSASIRSPFLFSPSIGQFLRSKKCILKNVNVSLSLIRSLDAKERSIKIAAKGKELNQTNFLFTHLTKKE